jgi:hypothetical protein
MTDRAAEILQLELELQELIQKRDKTIEHVKMVHEDIDRIAHLTELGYQKDDWLDIDLLRKARIAFEDIEKINQALANASHLLNRLKEAAA